MFKIENSHEYSFFPPDEDPAKYYPTQETFSCIADAFDASIMSQRMIIDDVTLPADRYQAIAELLSGEKDQQLATVAMIRKSLLQIEPWASNLLQQRRRRRID